MTLALATLRDEVGASTNEDTALQRTYDLTKTLLDAYIADSIMDATNAPVPDSVYDEAHLRMAVEDWNRTQAPNGFMLQQFDSSDSTPVPVRVSTDPYRSIRDLLGSWCLSVAIG